MKPKPFEIIVEFIPQCTKTAITYETYQKGLLIRCKDCKYWDGDDGDTFCSELGIFGTDPNSFCSYAKRKEE
jgi:hypothetical protein